MSSLRLVTGRSFLTTPSETPVLNVPIGTRSLEGSIGAFLSRTGACANWLCRMIKSVYPSGADRTTVSAAIIPSPPGLFSTTTGVLSSLVRYSASARAVASFDDPGAWAATMRMGLDGHGWASATRGKLAATTALPPARRNPRRARFAEVSSARLLYMCAS
ncbi:hypothetical protein D3C86_1779940 [compost metagenome]